MKVDPAVSLVNEKLADVSNVGFAGESVIVVAGAALWIVFVWMGLESVLRFESVATANSLCDPSDTEAEFHWTVYGDLVSLPTTREST